MQATVARWLPAIASALGCAAAFESGPESIEYEEAQPPQVERPVVPLAPKATERARAPDPPTDPPTEDVDCPRGTVHIEGCCGFVPECCGPPTPPAK